jgi:glutamate racemase
VTASDRPIGVFDSGIGGLTVVRELRARLPDESIIYFGDTARVPYGAKSPATVARYSEEAAAFLLSRDVKLIVIACNTATAHAFDRLSTTLPVPVIGVIEPGARAAVSASRTGRIGVIGTAGTIRSGAYDLAVRRRLDSARVYAQPCPLFVPLVEEGLCDGEATRIIAREYLEPLREMDVDVLILGCTHYPLLRPLLQDVMGPDVTLVDSAEQTALDVAQALESLGARAPGNSPATCTFIASDSPLRFRDVGRMFVGEMIGSVEHVDVEAWDRGERLTAGS